MFLADWSELPLAYGYKIFVSKNKKFSGRVTKYFSKTSKLSVPLKSEGTYFVKVVAQNKKGKTIFFSSHSISEVEKLCHRVGILVDGQLKKVVTQSEWSGAEGKLEQIFIDTVS